MRPKVQAFATLAVPALVVALAVRGAYVLFLGGVAAPTLQIATGVAAIVCGVWSQIERKQADRLRRSITAVQTRSRADLHLRDALIGEVRQAVVAWDSAGGEPLSFCGGSELLATCLAGADGAAVSTALARLHQHGTPFALNVDNAQDAAIALRGSVVAGHAVVFFHRTRSSGEPERRSASTALAERKLNHLAEGCVHALNQLGHAVAIFGHDRRLMFHNRAYARLSELTKTWLDGGPGEGEILDRLRELRRLPEQTDFAAWKRAQLELFETSGAAVEELWHLPGGAALRVVARRRPAGGFVYLFEDVSEQFRQKSAYNALIKVQQATLDTLQEGVAVFGTDGRLKLHNNAFARQWRLHDDELGNAPHLNAIANACERRFGRDRIWKTISASVTSASPDHLGGYFVVERSDERIISIALTRLPDGATLVTFSDLTDHVRLQAALREQPIASVVNEA